MAEAVVTLAVAAAVTREAAVDMVEVRIQTYPDTPSEFPLLTSR